MNQRYIDEFSQQNNATENNKKLNIGAAREINFQKFNIQTMEANLQRLDERESFQHKNLRGMIRYAKKLMVELEEFKLKCHKAEGIINDLKKAGSDNMGDLISMMKNFKTREKNTMEEIEKLRQLLEIKNNEINNCDVEIQSFNDFLDNYNRQQGNKINEYKSEIEENRHIIKRQDKLIVDLQQRNEVQDTAINDTRKRVMEREKAIVKLQLKNNELVGRKDEFIDDMNTLDLKTKWLKSRQETLTDLVVKCDHEGMRLPLELHELAKRGIHQRAEE